MASLSRFVTISVDDGHPADQRTAELLAKYGLKATFYAPAENREQRVLPVHELRRLATHFEVGGHSMHHTALSSLSTTEARAEIVGCKQWLEDTIGQRVVSFCYPRGKFDRSLAQLVREAGFLGARTCMFNLHKFPQDPFLWGVSTHAYPHSHTIQMRHALLEGNFAGAWNYWSTYRGERNWVQHFLLALEHVVEQGGIAHLYMHSWEIDQMAQWDTLETVFQEITRRPTLVRVTNGELFGLWQAQHDKDGYKEQEKTSE